MSNDTYEVNYVCMNCKFRGKKSKQKGREFFGALEQCKNCLCRGLINLGVDQDDIEIQIIRNGN